MKFKTKKHFKASVLTDLYVAGNHHHALSKIHLLNALNLKNKF